MMLKRHTFGLTPEKTRLLILLFTITACLALTFYVGFIMGQQIVYPHFFYIPIILAGLWYYKKAIYAALFLSIIYILIMHLSTQIVTLASFERCAVLIAVAYIIGLFSEKRVKRVKKLVEERNLLRVLMDNVPDWIFFKDAKLRFTGVNRALVQFLGVANPKEAIGKTDFDFFPRKTAQRLYDEEQRIIQSGQPVVARVGQTPNRDGEMLWVSETKMALHDETGKVVGLVGISRDITKLKWGEGELIRSEKLKALGEMAGGVAHDFNNLLTIILANTQLLERGIQRYGQREIRKRLRTIAQTAYEGGETVRRLQHFTQREILTQNFAGVDLNEIAREAIASTSPRWKDEAESKGITIRIIKELGKLPPISGNRSELMEVLTNLIFNALEAMPQGGEIVIKTETREKDVFLYFTDTGQGISSKIKDEIFDPFFTTKGPQASGLGLSVSYGIIKHHQGKIKVDSIKGKGTTFTIRIPVRQQVLLKKEKVKDLEKISSRKILVIDDEEGVRDVLGGIFQHEGHRVTLAETGKKGLEEFKKTDFDLVLTDLGMPEMSGWEVAKRIKEIDPDMPVGLITGWAVATTKEKMKEEGVDFILSKPFDYTKILKEVNVVLKSKKR